MGRLLTVTASRSGNGDKLANIAQYPTDELIAASKDNFRKLELRFR